MKILLFILMSNLLSNCCLSNTNDSLYIGISKSEVITGVLYHSIVISEDSTDVIGNLSWSGKVLYYNSNKKNGKATFLSTNFKRKNYDKISYFGSFSTIKLIRKSKSKFSVVKLNPIPSHVYVLETVEIISESKEKIILKFNFNNKTGKSESRLLEISSHTLE